MKIKKRKINQQGYIKMNLNTMIQELALPIRQILIKVMKNILKLIHSRINMNIININLIAMRNHKVELHVQSVILMSLKAQISIALTKYLRTKDLIQMKIKVSITFKEKTMRVIVISVSVTLRIRRIDRCKVDQRSKSLSIMIMNLKTNQMTKRFLEKGEKMIRNVNRGNIERKDG